MAPQGHPGLEPPCTRNGGRDDAIDDTISVKILYDVTMSYNGLYHNVGSNFQFNVFVDVGPGLA